MKILRTRVANSLFVLSLALGAASCVSTDDTTVTPTSPTDNPTANPLASLSPSSSFDWEMYNNQDVTISINDRYSNQYDYVLQVFDEQPTTGVSPISVGTARGNSPLSVSLDVNQRSSLLYVRQIDPAGRVETFSFEKPATQSADLALYSTASAPAETKAVTRVVATSDAPAIFTAPAMPDNLVSATEYPATASEDLDGSDSQWSLSGDYVVKAGNILDVKDGVTFQGNPANIYVAGTLNLGNFKFQRLNIYVLAGGKLVGEDFTANSGVTSLYIAKGASASLKKITLKSSSQLVVDGSLTATSITGASDGTIMYFGGASTVDVSGNIDGSPSYFYLDADQEAGTGATVSCANVTHNNSNTTFVVKNLAKLTVSDKIKSKSTLYNSGLVSTKDYDGSDGAIYNTCTITISNELTDLHELYMYNASLSGPWDEETSELTAIPSATSSDNTIDLYDGSYIYINNFKQDRLVINGYITDDTKEASLIRLEKSKVENQYSNSTMNGAVKLWAPEKYHVSFKATNGASKFTDAQDVPYDLETCSGLVVEQIPAEPDEPAIINGSLKGHYTVNFEDKWPKFSDYDLNDIVYHVGAVTTVQTPAGIINEVTVNMQLLAVGATYDLALGLQIPSLKASDIQEATVSSLGQVGATTDDLGAMELDGSKNIEQAGATDPVVIPLFYDAHAFLTGTVHDASTPRIMVGTGSVPVAPREVTLHITFAAGANIDASKLGLDNFDFFLYRPADEFAVDGKRVEIHLMDFLPTVNATDVYFGTSNDASVVASGKTYRSADNFPWAIRVMDNTEETTSGEEVSAEQVPWKWAIEGKSINIAYPGFASWVNSGSDADADWTIEE